MKWREWLENWNITSLKIKPPFFEAIWEPKDKDAAGELPEVTASNSLEAVDSWLGEEYSTKLHIIREKVKALHKNNMEEFGDMLSHTTHGVDHCSSMDDLLHRLVPGDLHLELYERERFYLLASAWLHDIGTLPIVSKETLPDDKDNTSKAITNPHLSTEKFIMEHFDLCGLEEVDKVFMSKLCRYHYRQEDLQECDEELVVENIGYKLKLLTAYLRLADALDVVPLPPDSSSYAVFLAYDISTNSKLNWIKRNLITGTIIDPGAHRIYVEFSIPTPEQINATGNAKWINDKLDYVINLSMNNLRDDLESVMSVLVRAQISYYLDIEIKKTEVRIDDQALPDLMNMIMNYDILNSPSSSKLWQMILITIANIAGYFLSLDKTFQKYPSTSTTNSEKIQHIYDFISKLKLAFSMRKSRHFGVDSLLENCKEFLSDASENIDKFISNIQTLYKRNENARTNIRKTARIFLENNSDLVSLINNENNEGTFNILLYGYSESVIKAICGFRDHMLSNNFGKNVDDFHQFYGSIAEKNSFNNVRIFVCEGRPKTQTVLNDRLSHQDGLLYASELGHRNFANIVLIPDIVAGDIMRKNSIHLIIVGANGFNNKVFTHSSGQRSIIATAYQFKARNPEKIAPKILLTVSSDKWSPNDYEDPIYSTNSNVKMIEVEGFKIFTELGGNKARDNIWLSRDKSFVDKLRKYDITLFNPREDIIYLKYLDFIISSNGFYSISADNDEETQKNIHHFIEENKFNNQI